MAKTVDEYVAGLSGWQAGTVAALRRDILSAAGVTETFKWGHPVYEARGLVCLIKSYKAQVNFGFWRGQELKGLDSRLEGDNPNMAHIKLREADNMSAAEVRRLVTAAIVLNREQGDPLKGV